MREQKIKKASENYSEKIVKLFYKNDERMLSMPLFDKKLAVKLDLYQIEKAFKDGAKWADATPDWHLFNEFLNSSDEYIVCSLHGDISIGINIKGKEWFTRSGVRIHDVVYYMPMPRQPQKISDI